MSPSCNPQSDDSDNGSPAHLVSRRPTLQLRTAREAPEDVLLLNRQRTARADWDAVRRFLRRMSGELETPAFTVCLLSDQAIRRFNRKFCGVDRPTDVLSFPAEERKNGGRAYLGDILISVETARANARRYGLRLEEEIQVLALHGVLHLLGYDHERDHGKMARLERRWSRRLGLSQSLTGRAQSSR